MGLGFVNLASEPVGRTRQGARLLFEFLAFDLEATVGLPDRLGPQAASDLGPLGAPPVWQVAAGRRRCRGPPLPGRVATAAPWRECRGQTLTLGCRGRKSPRRAVQGAIALPGSPGGTSEATRRCRRALRSLESSN